MLNTISNYVQDSLSILFSLLTIGGNVLEIYKIESLAVVCEIPDVFRRIYGNNHHIERWSWLLN